MNNFKILICIVFFHSCTSFTYSDSAKYLVGYFSSFESDNISIDFYNNQRFSFANVKIGRGPASTIVLAYINEGKYEWRSSDNIRIYTRNERIIETSGFQTDSAFFYNSHPEFIDGDTGSGTVTFRNPDLIRANFNYTISEKKPSEIIFLDQLYSVEVYEELFEIPIIRWTSKNIYYVKDGKVLRSVSQINPNIPKIKIDFYYK